MYVDSFLLQHGHFISSVLIDMAHVLHFFQPLPSICQPHCIFFILNLSHIFLQTFNQKHHHYNQLLLHNSHIS